MTEEVASSASRERLNAAAQDAIHVLERCFGGGTNETVLDGEPIGAGERPSTDAVNALAARLELMASAVKEFRIEASGSAEPSRSLPAATSGPGRLPLNRKERFYTGTVLPAIVASDSFAHLPHLLRLCGFSIPQPDWAGRNDDVQFFTEYSFAESVFTPEDRRVWPNAKIADTPDIVVATGDRLLAIEAKFYHRPSPAALRAQMDRQSLLVEEWRMRLDLSADAVRHVALLPERLASELGDVGHQVVTWEHVLETYEGVAPTYWHRFLRTALDRYDDLASRPTTFGGNADGFITGGEMFEESAAVQLTDVWVGRGAGGATGKLFAEDVRTGDWRARQYEMSEAEVAPNRNWFSVSEFVSRVGESDT